MGPRTRSSAEQAALGGAAHRIIAGALTVVAGERIVVFTDRENVELADIICLTARNIGAKETLFLAEDLGPRPHDGLNAKVADALANAQASVLMVSFHKNELPMRSRFADLAAKHGLRHAHIVGVGKDSIVRGMSIDPHRIAETARAIRVRLGATAEITVKSTLGTNLNIRFAPWCRWMVYTGVIRPGQKDNLPSGELVTCPDQVSGTYVADGTLGDADGLLSRGLRDTPVTLTIANGRVNAIECPKNPLLARQIQTAIRATANLDRVGLVNFGLNTGLERPFGNVFTDQKVPGVHLGLGLTFAEKTGASWNSATWIAFTTASCDVDIDRRAVIRSGRFLL